MAMLKDETGTGTAFSLDSLDTPQSQRVESTVLVDLRRSPRIAVSFPAAIHLKDGRHVLAMITNISRSGLRVEGSSELVDTLFGGEILLDNHDSVLAEFRFTMPGADGGDMPVVVWGRTVYARQDSGGYQVGVEFRNFSGGRDALFDYLASRGVHQ